MKKIEVIHRNTVKHYEKNKTACAYFNWVARMEAFLILKKLVWPVPLKSDIDKFKFDRGYKEPRKRLKNGED